MTIGKRLLTGFFIYLITNLSSINARQADPVTDLPLQISLSKGYREELIIYITGDGGWNSFNQQLVSAFGKQGYGVVALNSRKYFWSEKTPQDFACDFQQFSDYYLKQWGKTSFIIVGYSFGADVVCFLPHLISDDMNHKIKKIALISPSASTDFTIRLGDLISENENVNRKYKVRPQIEQIALPVVCTFGKEEVKLLKRTLVQSRSLSINELPGDHRYNNDFALLLQTICR